MTAPRYCLDWLMWVEHAEDSRIHVVQGERTAAIDAKGVAQWLPVDRTSPPVPDVLYIDTFPEAEVLTSVTGHIEHMLAGSTVVLKPRAFAAAYPDQGRSLCRCILEAYRDRTHARLAAEIRQALIDDFGFIRTEVLFAFPRRHGCLLGTDPKRLLLHAARMAGGRRRRALNRILAGICGCRHVHRLWPIQLHVYEKPS